MEKLSTLESTSSLAPGCAVVRGTWLCLLINSLQCHREIRSWEVYLTWSKVQKQTKLNKALIFYNVKAKKVLFICLNSQEQSLTCLTIYFISFKFKLSRKIFEWDPAFLFVQIFFISLTEWRSYKTARLHMKVKTLKKKKILPSFSLSGSHQKSVPFGVSPAVFGLKVNLLYQPL